MDLIKDECTALAILGETRQWDQEILDMLPANMSAPAKNVDKHLVAIERHLNIGVRLLSQLWTKLIEARKSVSPVSLNGVDLCKLVELTIIALGQTKQLVTYTR